MTFSTFTILPVLIPGVACSSVIVVELDGWLVFAYV
jgi:hypothetical protein